MFNFYLMTPPPLNCIPRALVRAPINFILLLFYFSRLYISRGNCIRITACPGKIDEENYENMESIAKQGFHLRGGAERDSIGIYMWRYLFILPRFSSFSSTNGDKVTVILVDSQDMFDYETIMALIASIFGLAMLLVSYQIYDVDKRI